MAYAHSDATPRHGFVHSVFSNILNSVLSLGETNRRARDAEFLMSLSDEALAKRGLKRQDIAQYVYRDLFWT